MARDLDLQKWTPEQMAHRALCVLNDRQYPLETADLCKYMAQEVDPLASGLHSRNHVQVREALNRLYACGKVNKREKSKAKHIWTLLVESWDQYDPFSPAPGHKPAPREYKPVEPEPVEDEPAVGMDEGGEMDEATSKNIARLNDLVASLKTENRDLLDRQEKMVNLMADIAASANKAHEKAEQALAAAPREVHITRYDGSTAVLPNEVLPPQFDEVKDLVGMRMNVLLIGPAGCGKTRLAETVATAFGLKFGSISCTAGMSEAHLLGRAGVVLDNGQPADKKNKAKKPPYTPTEFVHIFETGGVFLLDEIDAADPNLLLCINQALANGRLPLPNRGDAAVRHPDFVVIATANTYGRGATRVYAGRNQLDDATLDRFRIGTVEMTYDAAVERQLCPDDSLLTAVWKIREKVMDTAMHRTVSTRFLIDAFKMKKGAKWTDEVILKKLTAGWTKDELNKVGLGSGIAY